MKKFIATTTINNEPEKTSYKLFLEEHPDWTLVISGDEDTSENEYRDFVREGNAVYLSLGQQQEIHPKLHKVLGKNTDTRKMFSILYSYLEGADVVALVDDDNYPLPEWGKNLWLEKEEIDCYCYTPETPDTVVDPIYMATSNPSIWHRGIPLEDKIKRHLVKQSTINFKPLIQADMWYGEPDTDAICRFLGTTEGCFDKQSYYSGSFPFTVNGFSPFNAQNVFLSRKIVPFYFLFPSLGRMSDIWIAYYLESLYKQPIVIYGQPSVIQYRNPHNVLNDFQKEILGYLNNKKLVEDLSIFSPLFFNYITKKEFNMYLQYIMELKKEERE